MKKLLLSSLLALSLLLTSCATIVSGSKQKVEFTSTPSDATVLVNDTNIGKTPLKTKLKRNTSYKVLIQLEGYEDYNTNIEKQFNAWYIGNIMLGGAVGLIIDPITGAMFKLSNTNVKANLIEKPTVNTTEVATN